MPKHWPALLSGVFGLLLGLALAPTLEFPTKVRAQGEKPVVPAAPAAYRAEEPAYRGLDANLYMQTSAEYRACCYQAYNLAGLRLKEGYQTARDKGIKQLAVIMDLDETVLDNAGFQAMMLRSNLAYDQRLWDQWEMQNAEQVGLIPGAKTFIKMAENLGVTVFYISNRKEQYRQHTKQALKNLGILLPEERQLLLNDDPKSTDKTTRRKQVEKDYTVLLYLGDNLRDFDEKFKCIDLGKKTPEDLAKAIQARKMLVDDDRAQWGAKWIILPNPAYGEWTKPLGMGKQDLDRLAPPIAVKP